MQISQIPDYLRSGEFYKVLLANNDDESTFLLDEKYCFFVSKINSIEEFENVIEMLQYWIISDIPWFVYDYISEMKFAKPKNIQTTKKIKEIVNNSPYNEELNILVEANIVNDYFRQLSLESSERNLLNLLKYAHSKGIDLDHVTFSYAVKSGKIDCLRYLDENNCEFDLYTSELVAEFGDLETFKYVIEHSYPIEVNSVFCELIRLNKFDFFKYLYQKKPSINEIITTTAASCGKLEFLKLAREMGARWDGTCCISAAAKGHLDCLAYTHENGCPWTSEVETQAIIHGHFECFKYAHENGCPQDHLACYNAAKYGHLNCLEYATQKGFPLNGMEYHVAHQNLHLECYTYLINLEKLKYDLPIV